MTYFTDEHFKKAATNAMDRDAATIARRSLADADAGEGRG